MPETVKILYEDSWLVLCIKPIGVSSESDGMPMLLSNQLGGRFYCVHRLDMGVSGVMVYARDGKTADQLTKLFSANQIKKEYLAVVSGRPDAVSGQMKDLLYHDKAKNKTYIVKKKRSGVKEALLDYECLASAELDASSVSLMKVILHSGRSHQIRVQFASRKMPLLGDGKYGSRIKLSSPALYSHCLEFSHPKDERPLSFRVYPENYPWSIFERNKEE